MRFLALTALLVACFVAAPALAHNPAGAAPDKYRVGRYTSIDSSAPRIQRDLLAAPVDLVFPDSVRTVGQALAYILRDSGYRLASVESSDPAMPTLLALPLPSAHRQFKQVSLRSALKALAGDAWVLVIDPVNRLVSFDLSDRFRSGEADPS